MESQTELDFKSLKSKVRQVNLETFIPPLFPQILNTTTKTARVAIELRKANVLKLEEMHQCLDEPRSFYQNLELYKLVMKKNAGEALMDALYQTSNLQVIQVVKKNLEDAEMNKCQVNEKNVAQMNVEVLNASTFSSNLNLSDKFDKLVRLLYKKDVLTLDDCHECGTNLSSLDQNLEVIKSSGEDPCIDVQDKPQPFDAPQIVQTTLDNTPLSCHPSTSVSTCLLPAFQAIRISSISVGDSSKLLHLEETCVLNDGIQNWNGVQEVKCDQTLVRLVTGSFDLGKICSTENFSLNELYSDEAKAIAKFIEKTLGFDRETNRLSNPPREIYINCRSFTSADWEWFSKLLYNLCRDSLQNLTLDHVNMDSYLQGLAWMKYHENDVPCTLWFIKLEDFLIKGIVGQLNEEELNAVLLLVKHRKYTLEDLWNEHKIRIRMGKVHGNEFHIDLHPSKGLLSLGPVELLLQAKLLELMENRKLLDTKQIIPVTRLHIYRPKMDIVDPGRNLGHLTHLLVECWNLDEIKAIDKILQSLSVLKSLKYLALSTTGSNMFDVTLELINVLEHLSFLFLMQARVHTNRLGVEAFPWPPSVRKVILMSSEFNLKSKFASFFDNKRGIFLEPECGEPCKIEEISMDEGMSSSLNEFYK